MSAANESPRRYPVVCPGCQEPKGYPYEVRTLSDQPGAIEIKLRCRDCNREWVETVSNHE